MPRWYFKKLNPGDTTREPIQGEFFANEAIDDSADALVREGIQNTLDARRVGMSARVRICISGDAGAIEPRTMEQYVEGIEPHLFSRDNGLHYRPSLADRCRYLVFEDFGTTGLEGDPQQWRKSDGERNGFFNFFRSEGHSDKGETDRGRWGVGKTVFPRASLANTFWGITVRASDGSRLLMGRAILKSHSVDSDWYVPDGYFGEQGEGELVLPVSDARVIQKFCDDFRLHRGNEPGLSVVIPWYDPEGVKFKGLLQAVVRGYFFPILTGELTVSLVDEEGRTHELTAASLLSIVRTSSDELSQPMSLTIELAQWACSTGKAELKKLNRPSDKGALRWSADLIPEDLVVEIREKLQGGERIALRVPMPVREKGKPAQWSHFDLFFVRDGGDTRGRPIFVREGIIIPDVRGRTTRGIRSLVVIEDQPLATMLGDAENPSHTQWQKGCANYKDKYLFGPSNIQFVTDSVAEVVRLVTETDRECDPTVLIDLFSLPVQPEGNPPAKARVKEPQSAPGTITRGSVDAPVSRPRAYRLQKVDGGFQISRGDEGAGVPESLRIRVAYDVRRGSPLKKYDEADFDLSKRPIQVAERIGVEVLRQSRNTMEVKILRPDFRLRVTGFDANRDLYVSITARKGDSDANQSS